jgi:hypothetical protein
MPDDSTTHYCEALDALKCADHNIIDDAEYAEYWLKVAHIHAILANSHSEAIYRKTFSNPKS